MSIRARLTRHEVAMLFCLVTASVDLEWRGFFLDEV